MAAYAKSVPYRMPPTTNIIPSQMKRGGPPRTDYGGLVDSLGDRMNDLRIVNVGPEKRVVYDNFIDVLDLVLQYAKKVGSFETTYWTWCLDVVPVLLELNLVYSKGGELHVLRTGILEGTLGELEYTLRLDRLRTKLVHAHAIFSRQRLPVPLLDKADALLQVDENIRSNEHLMDDDDQYLFENATGASIDLMRGSSFKLDGQFPAFNFYTHFEPLIVSADIAVVKSIKKPTEAAPGALGWLFMLQVFPSSRAQNMLIVRMLDEISFSLMETIKPAFEMAEQALPKIKRMLESSNLVC